MRIGIYGGSFNPPHIAHLAVAEQCAAAGDLDVVLWIPAATSPHKQGDPVATAAEDRFAMVGLATAGNDRFDVSAIELERGGVSYMVDTLRELRRIYPDAELRLIMGMDSLSGFSSWREPDEIVKMAPLIVYVRPGSDPPADSRFSDATTLVEGPPLDLSSTLIRASVRDGRSVRYLVPDDVLEYIVARGLYKD